MLAVTWVLFYPELRTPLSFHLCRHLFLVLFVFLAVRADPCFFSVFLALLSVLDYTRRTSSRWLPTTYLSVFVGFYLGAHLSASLLPWTVVRSLFLFAPFVFDRFFVKRVGFSPVLTYFAFPVVLAASNYLLSLIDPLGIATNIASFCNDYPDFTFLPLRFGGAPVLVAFVGLLAALTSRWRSTRTLPKFVFMLLFKGIPTLTVIIWGGRWLGAPSRVVRIGGVVANATASCGSVVSALSDLAKSNQIVGLAGVLRNCSDADWTKIVPPEGGCIIAADDENVIAFQRGGKIVKMAHQEIEGSQNALFLNSAVGRLLILTDRQIFHTKCYTARDADVIVSVHGREDDEVGHLPLKNSMIVSQSTGASRLHFSAFADSFLVSADGHAVYTEEFQAEAIYTFVHSVKLAPTAFGGCALRTKAVEFTIFGAGIATVIGALFPRNALLSFSREISRIGIFSEE
jgi:hypothetical protein